MYKIKIIIGINTINIIIINSGGGGGGCSGNSCSGVAMVNGESDGWEEGR